MHRLYRAVQDLYYPGRDIRHVVSVPITPQNDGPAAALPRQNSSRGGSDRRRSTAMRLLSAIMGAAAAVLAGLGVPAAAQDNAITVFAAASLKNVFDDIDTAFARKTGRKVVASYAASSALMKQIEQGAPADLFASADLDWMEYGIQKKLINEASRVNLLGNKLVLIAPKDSKIETVAIGQNFGLAGLAGDGRIVTGDARFVPVGKYAKAALERLGSWSPAEKKFAFVENVRAALVLVARGEAALGL